MAYTSRVLQCSKPPGLIAARLLGYLLVRSENGCETLAREIINASSDTKLLELAQHYLTHFVKVCTYVGRMLKPGLEYGTGMAAEETSK